MVSLPLQSVVPHHCISGLDQVWAQGDLNMLTMIMNEKFKREFSFVKKGEEIVATWESADVEDGKTDVQSELEKVFVLGPSAAAAEISSPNDLSASSVSSCVLPVIVPGPVILKELLVTITLPQNFPLFESRKSAKFWVQKVSDPKFGKHIGKSKNRINVYRLL